MVSFSAEAVAAAASRDVLQVFQIGCSWGGFESLMIMPFYTMPEEEVRRAHGTSSGIVRIYCGLEGAEHQIRDLEHFLERL